MARSKVFISYSHADRDRLQKVQEQLGVLVAGGLISSFDDTQIGVGEYWEARLDQAMLEAQIALLLISAPFLNSEFIRKSEVPQLFARHETAGMEVYPLVVRSCAWETVPWLAKLQIKKPETAASVASLPDRERDDFLANVARDVAKIVRRHHPTPTIRKRIHHRNLPGAAAADRI